MSRPTSREIPECYSHGASVKTLVVFELTMCSRDPKAMGSWPCKDVHCTCTAYTEYILEPRVTPAFLGLLTPPTLAPPPNETLLINEQENQRVSAYTNNYRQLASLLGFPGNCKYSFYSTLVWLYPATTLPCPSRGARNKQPSNSNRDQ